MKNIFALCFPLFFFNIQILAAQSAQNPNIILITTDGLRWQEVFNGIDTTLIPKENFAQFINYKGKDIIESREKLMPFFWNSLVNKGQLHGNRKYGNRMDTKNYHRFSYPGYSEMLCGFLIQKSTAILRY